jgi:hypothetical protein
MERERERERARGNQGDMIWDGIYCNGELSFVSGGGFRIQTDARVLWIIDYPIRLFHLI